MSWDVVLFNSRQRITDPEQVDEAQLEPTDFAGILNARFYPIVADGHHLNVAKVDNQT